MITWMVVIKKAFEILAPALEKLTPELKGLVIDFVRSLYEKAKLTENPWDDKFVEILAEILGVELPVVPGEVK